MDTKINAAIMPYFLESVKSDKHRREKICEEFPLLFFPPSCDKLYPLQNSQPSHQENQSNNN